MCMFFFLVDHFGYKDDKKVSIGKENFVESNCIYSLVNGTVTNIEIADNIKTARII